MICAYRHQDIPTSVLATVDKCQATKPTPSDSQTTVAQSTPADAPVQAVASTPASTASYYDEADVAELSEQQRYNLRHRELFFSKCTDTIAATTIRAKCSVFLFNDEIEKYSEYLAKEVGC